jgi:hypothetical protein
MLVVDSHLADIRLVGIHHSHHHREVLEVVLKAQRKGLVSGCFFDHWRYSIPANSRFENQFSGTLQGGIFFPSGPVAPPTAPPAALS